MVYPVTALSHSTGDIEDHIIGKSKRITVAQTSESQLEEEQMNMNSSERLEQAANPKKNEMPRSKVAIPDISIVLVSSSSLPRLKESS